MRLDRIIDGDPYAFESNQWGWAVGCRGAMTDRFYRNYQITTTPGGRPMKCSCPRAVHGGKWCKHLRAAEELWHEGINPMDKRDAPSESEVPF